MRLKDKVAIITGGSRGIGYATADKFLKEGAAVIVTASTQGSADRAVTKLKEKYPDAIVDGISPDLASLESVRKAFKEVTGKYGCVDILVNNAGVAPKERKDLLEMSEESFDRVLGINTKGTMFLTQLAAKQMIKQEQIFKSKGHIVNVGSCSAEVSSTSRGEYCVSKAAVSMLTTLFADRLAPEGILVNEVRPGVIATDMTSVVTEKYDTMIKNGVFPIARWGKAEDVAEMIAFFCSDSVLYTTGNYVDVDGGFHIKRL